MAKEEQEALVGKFVEKFKCKHVSSQRAARTITSVCGKFYKIEKVTPFMHFGSKNIQIYGNTVLQKKLCIYTPL